MKPLEVTLAGRVAEDGSLIVDGKPELPPGRVEVVVRSARSADPLAESLLQVLEPIWADLDAQGFCGRTLEQAVADVRALRGSSVRDRRCPASCGGCRGGV
jgi:hypothetical protein